MANRPDAHRLTPEEFNTKRRAVWERLSGELEALRAKKATGTLTAEEGERLERLEELRKRFAGRAPKVGGVRGGVTNSLPAEGPSPKVPADGERD